MATESDHSDQDPSSTGPSGDGIRQHPPSRPIPKDAIAVAAIDRWAAEHPAHPRVSPWAVYVALMAVAMQLRDWQSWTYLPSKALQVIVVVYLVWRFRHLMPEVSLRFHWSVLPVSAALVVCWILLNGWMISSFPSLADAKPGFFETLKGENEPLFWAAAIVHLVAMCSAVPIVEEIFNRSLVLRAASDPSGIRAAALQLICELPIIGGWVGRSAMGQWANGYPVSLGEQFSATPLGKLTASGVAVSTCLFMLVHGIADWPGAVVCGVVWCLQLHKTRQLGLGPVIWSHAMVNGLLWLYVVTTNAWQFI